MGTFQDLLLTACWTRDAKTPVMRLVHEVITWWALQGYPPKSRNNEKMHQMTNSRSHLRQSISLQPSISSWPPSQSFPPFLGVGFEQFRSLTCFPLPHHLSHSDHSSHSLHPPSPGKPGSRKAVRDEEYAKQFCRSWAEQYLELKNLALW